MKKTFIFYFFVLMCFFSLPGEIFSQNVGIGTTTPPERLSLVGSLLVRAQTVQSTTSPDAAHTYSLPNGGDTARYVTDSAYRIYDPSGPVNYTPGMQGSVLVIDTSFYFGTGSVGGLELVFESIALGTGDSIMVTDLSNPPQVLFACSNEYNGLVPAPISGIALRIFFKANGDASVGAGFSALLRRLYAVGSSPPGSPMQNYGNSSLYFNAARGSFKVGIANGNNLGIGAVALGVSAIAKGSYSTAIGSNSAALNEQDFALAGGTANGISAIAIGGSALYNESIAVGRGSISSGSGSAALSPFAQAVGTRCVALGTSSMAEGNYSMAMLRGHTTNNSNYATAIGFNSVASQNNSVAIGAGAIADGSSAFALGENAKAGTESVAFGKNTNAQAGSNNIAIGTDVLIYNGVYSTGIGKNITTSGIGCTVLGNNASAGGTNSVTIGSGSSSSGTAAMALGNNVSGDGNYSTAMGSYVSTSGFEGCLTIGDHSTTTTMQTFVANGFRSRFAGGYRLFTNTAANVGAFLNANANSWAALSDVRLKENFIPVDGEVFLHKIAAMPQFSWNYIGQDVKTLRHYGPMAQDFYGAFGKDALGEIGCDTLINQQDFLGVNLIAIQALEKRTQKIALLENESAALKKQNEELLKRIEKLESLLTSKK